MMKTLNVKFPIGKIFAQSLLLLTAFLLLLEGFVRIPSIERVFSPYEFYGSSNKHFDAQVKNIRERKKQEGKINCIFIGSSQVLYGIDPAVIEETYHMKTGGEIVCQNFGIGGLSPATTAFLIPLLIEKFDPAIIIVGTSVLDYMSGYASNSNVSIMSSPWVQYQMGTFSVDGWLIEHSRAYQYYLGVDHYVLTGGQALPALKPNGHAKDYSGHTRMSVEDQIEYFKNLISSSSKLSAQQVNALSRILKLKTAATQIIIMEPPMTETMFKANKKVSRVYPEFLNMLKKSAARSNAPLWLTQGKFKIMEDDWYDLIHLNDSGAAAFSRMIGENLAEYLPVIDQ